MTATARIAARDADLTAIRTMPWRTTVSSSRGVRCAFGVRSQATSGRTAETGATTAAAMATLGSPVLRDRPLDGPIARRRFRDAAVLRQPTAHSRHYDRVTIPESVRERLTVPSSGSSSRP